MSQKEDRELEDFCFQALGVIELERLESFAVLRDWVIRARRLRVPWIILPWQTRNAKGEQFTRQVAIKPLSCPESLLDRRTRTGAFYHWVFSTRIY